MNSVELYGAVTKAVTGHGPMLSDAEYAAQTDFITWCRFTAV